MKTAQGLFLVGGFLASIVLAGWLGRATAPESRKSAVPDTVAASTSKRVLFYRNPMGLPDTSPVPKKDSMGMDYVPVYEGGEPEAPGTVVLSPEKIQKSGVRTAQVERRGLTRTVRASGTIMVDQSRQYAIAPKFEGWVQRLYANQVGMPVRRGQALMAVYSPELLSAQTEYQIAATAAETLIANDPESARAMQRLAEAAVSRLRNWDIGPAQLAAIRRGNAQRYLTIASPADAVVVEKPIVEGARFMPGETVLTLADLSRVWLVANVSSLESGQVQLGQAARFSSRALPGRSFEGKVTFLAPTIDAASRTLGVRIVLDNADGVLRPALFGDVELVDADAEEVLAVRRTAVLDSGRRQIVFVETSEGRFTPREVQVGVISGEWIEVTSGLNDGERVVVAANFLIDAESNLSSALDGLSVHQGHGAAAPPPAEAADANTSAAPPAAVEHKHDAKGGQ
jgi:membrane fusion protein, copper/silver efflux system